MDTSKVRNDIYKMCIDVNMYSAMGWLFNCRKYTPTGPRSSLEFLPL